jgi:hypothetical protein
VEGTDAGATSGDSTSGDSTSDDALADLQAKLDACTAALGVVQDGQSAAQAAQQGLLAAAQALDDAVATLSDALAAAGSDAGAAPGADDADGAGSGGPTTTSPDENGPSADGPSTDGPSADGASGGDARSGAPDGTSGTPSGSSGAPSSSSGSTATVTISAEQILANQADVDAAEAALAVAEANATRTALTSRIAGTVASIDVTAGSSVTAGTTAVTVLGESGYLVDVTVPLAQSKLLEPGQRAAASVAGTTTPVTGTVSSVGVVNQSETSTPSYTATITLDAESGALFDGSSAQVSVTVANAAGVIVVPTSAVTTTGGSRTVQVVENGVATTVTVEVGAVGPELTEITSGLQEGQQVALADLSQPVSGSSSSSEQSGLSGLGGPQTGGGFSGGVPGGVPGGGPDVVMNRG